MLALTSFYRFASLNLWGNLPSPLQRKISSVYANIYNLPFSKHIIGLYCRANYKDPAYLAQFCSESGQPGYRSFQDFFTRVYKQPPAISGACVWPCEGLLCDYGQMGQMPPINVKGDLRATHTIFGEVGARIPPTHYFSNVFLHNNNYHRIHSPARGTITHIERIAGDLVLLRPWVYKHDPSLPAMRNERVNVVVTTAEGQSWYLSIVGGPAVGTIAMARGLAVGSQVDTAQEIAKFLLGSTCCMAAPMPLQHTAPGQMVAMGQRL